MSPEEVIPYFYPQVYNIADMNLTEEEFPEVSTTFTQTLNDSLVIQFMQLEMLSRQTLRSDQIYLCYNALEVCIFVGV